MNSMSNIEDQLKSTINHTVVDLLEAMKSITPDERFAVLEECGDWIYGDIDVDDELLVPDMGRFNKHDKGELN